jgi:hypothetical protein
MSSSFQQAGPKLRDQARQYLRPHHYSIHTERSYVDWIVCSRDDLFPAEPKIEVYLTHLAVERSGKFVNDELLKLFDFPFELLISCNP